MYINDTGYPSVTQIISPYIDTEWFKPEHSERGIAVHNACEAYLKGVFIMPLKPEHQLYFDSFCKWADKAIDTVISTEERIVDPDRGYCGKYDAILKIKGDDQNSLWDWKTSQSKQSWWRLQASAYKNLINNTCSKEIKRGGSIRLKNDGSGCLVDTWYDLKLEFNIFIGLLNAHNFFK